MKRTFKQFTITAGGTPQPLIGTTLSAATGLGGTDPNGDQSLQSIAVVDSSMFLVGDWVVIGTKTVGDEDRCRVQKVADGTHISVVLTKTHLTGAFVRLSIQAQAVYVQTKKGNTGSIFIGTQGMTTAGYVKVIVELLQVAANVQPIDWSDPVRTVPDGAEVGDYWIDGTTADGYLPSLTIA